MPELVFSEEIGEYFKDLAAKNEVCYEVARKARRVGRDPKTEVEVPQAQDLASRVEKLLEDYNVTGVAEQIRRLTDEFGNREIVSLKTAEYMAAHSEGMPPEKALDRAIRVGLAVLTEGILVAPLEGIADTKIKQNPDGTQFVDLIFAGPIRAAGGTAQAMSVLLADVVRHQLGIGEYKPTQGEIDRFLEEIPLYKQCQHIQYSPSNEEIRLIVGNCPIMIDGEGTERVEISGFRDLPRIATNQVRGGACMVVAEGMCLKAAKLQKHVKKLGLQGWDFMDRYLEMKGAAVATNKDEARSVHKSDKYLKDIVAGRPIFGHPGEVGGFRLRYGRARTSGLASLAFSPASTYILDEFPALGTQLKIERPGKACVVTPCDQLDGPIVLLKNGDLVQCQTSAEAQAVKGMVSEITDNGEVLIPFGEFCENNHFLIPCGYPIEWHVQELEAYYEKEKEKEIGAELRAQVESEIRAKIDAMQDGEKKEKK
ncbi:MAG: DNA polymerase II large subunit, partial [Candidatus Methanomethylophilaceae archaeon]|nr:DNA polymerase II large subunit [Candidatus Methanomethylophilaceae archaeon]